VGLWEPSALVPVGHSQVRRGWVVVAGLGYLRAGAGALISSREAPDVLSGMARCLWSIGALPELMVCDRERCLHAGGGRLTESSWSASSPLTPQIREIFGDDIAATAMIDRSSTTPRPSASKATATGSKAVTSAPGSPGETPKSANRYPSTRSPTAADRRQRPHPGRGAFSTGAKGCNLVRP